MTRAEEATRVPGPAAQRAAGHGRAGLGAPVWTALAGSVAVALTAGLFADWDAHTGPLARFTVGWGFPLPGRVTTPSADLVAAVAVCAAALRAVLRFPDVSVVPGAAGTTGVRGAVRLLLWSWSVPVTAFCAGGLAGAVAGLAVGGSAGGPAETLWHLLAQAGHGGLFGVLYGAPAAVAVAATARLTARRADASGPVPARRRSPYAVLTGLLLLAPLAALALGAALLGTAPPEDCSPLACASPLDELLLTGEIGLRLAVPCWAAAMGTAAVLRALPRIGYWPVWTHLFLAAGAAGLAVVFLSGLVVGSSV